MSTFSNVVLGETIKPDIPKAVFSWLNSELPHSPVKVMTVASFSEEGMSSADTVYSVEGSGSGSGSGFWSSSFSCAQPSASAAKSTYCSWFSFSVTPESSTPSNIST